MISDTSAPLGLVYGWTDQTTNPTGEARAALRRILRDVGLDADSINDGVLATSELVANAHQHACGPYEMYFRSARGRYICEIHDGDPSVPANLYAAAAPQWPATDSEDRFEGPAPKDEMLAERGRGLCIVHELTRGQWGFRLTERGTKAAWILLPKPSLLRTAATPRTSTHRQPRPGGRLPAGKSVPLSGTAPSEFHL